MEYSDKATPAIPTTFEAMLMVKGSTTPAIVKK
jgi:hypothetical protein